MPPPNNIDAERACLSACISGTEKARLAIGEAVKALTPDDFYNGKHQHIFQAIISLYNLGKPVEAITITETLKASGLIEESGGVSYIASLLDEASISENISEYTDIIRDRSTRRRLMDVGHALLGQSQVGTVSTKELLENASQAIFRVSRHAFTDNHREVESDSSSEISSILERSDRIQRGDVLPSGIPTGFANLDSIITGLSPGDIMVVAARPGVGKTAFATSVALNLATRSQSIRPCIFSLEMSAPQIIRRMLSVVSGVNGNHIKRGSLFPEEREKIEAARDLLSQAKIAVDDSTRLSPVELRAKARSMLIRHPDRQGIVIVDYIGLMEASLSRTSYGENRQNDVAIISRSLKSIARELEVPIIVLSQLNRESEHRAAGHSPMLSDLRDSGAIEQDADMVLFLYHQSREPIGPDVEDVTVMANLSKHRNGPQGTFSLNFNRPTTRFSDATN